MQTNTVPKWYTAARLMNHKLLITGKKMNFVKPFIFQSRKTCKLTEGPQFNNPKIS